MRGERAQYEKDRQNIDIDHLQGKCYQHYLDTGEIHETGGLGEFDATGA
jgi:hypothetical protein